MTLSSVTQVLHPASRRTLVIPMGVDGCGVSLYVLRFGWIYASVCRLHDMNIDVGLSGMFPTRDASDTRTKYSTS